MKKSTKQIWLWFAVIGFVLVTLILLPVLPSHPSRAKVRIVYTRYEAKKAATLLKQYAIETGGLTNIDNSFIFQSLFGTNGHYYYSNRTNEQGELIDIAN